MKEHKQTLIEIRNATGAGMYSCWIAFQDSNFDKDKAIESLRNHRITKV